MCMESIADGDQNMFFQFEWITTSVVQPITVLNTVIVCDIYSTVTV